MQCLDSIVQKIQGGVVIHFEKVGLDPAPIAIAAEDASAQVLDNFGVVAQNGIVNGLVFLLISITSFPKANF